MPLLIDKTGCFRQNGRFGGAALHPIFWHRTEISCTILLVVVGALPRCAPLAVLALRRVARLASHPATTAKLHNLFLRGA